MSEDLDIGDNIIVRLLYAPHARHVIVESIRELSDVEYQQREWTKGPQERFSTAMPYIIHILYDDYGKLDHPDIIIHGIDILFYDEEEASLVHDLCYFLSEEISDDINIDIGYIDIEYMSHPKWPQLVAKATAVYMLLKANNEKYNFIEIRNEEHRDKYIEWQEKFRLERPQDC